MLTIIYKTDNKDLLISTGNYIQYLVINYKGKDSPKEYRYIHMYNKSLCCTLEANISIKKTKNYPNNRLVTNNGTVFTVCKAHSYTFLSSQESLRLEEQFLLVFPFYWCENRGSA